MGRYRKIDSRIHNDEKYAALSDDGKLVFLTLLTHPHMTALGAMRGNTQGLAAEFGWSHERLSKGFREGFAKGMVEYDEKHSFIGLPNFLKYNGPESPNVVKSWASAIDLIPECRLKVTLMYRVKVFTEGLPEAFRKALPEAFRKPLPNPEPEPEQEQEPEQKKTPNGVCPERFAANGESSGPPKVICEIVTKRKGEVYQVTEEKALQYADTYPYLDVRAEIKKARQWCIDNPGKRKTVRGMPGFLTRWLNRAERSQGSATASPALKAESREELRKAAEFEEGKREKPW